ncbi:MAG TPA: hypothetical protein GX513_04180, partial [Firmicutes bacterium]|nr:hypothetical protein [Bacillota bacterium]
MAFPRRVTVHYPWHPLAGRELEAYRRHRQAGEESLIVRLPDNTLAQIPSWMADAAKCAGACMVESPVCSVDALPFAT